MNKIQISETLSGAKCFCGYTKSQHTGVQAYLMAVIAGISTNAQYLASQSACFSCIHPSIQDGAFSYLIQQFTGVTGTPQQIIALSPCASCVPPGQYESLKTYLLYLIAYQGGAFPTPTALLNLASQFINLTPVQQYAVLTYVAQQAGGESFDPTLCAVTLADGGGDAFDCYTVGDTNFSLPNGGVRFSGLWVLANNFYLYPYGDDFQSYSVGTAGTLSAGTGFTGSWVTATQPNANPYGDTFDTYTVASPTTETLNSGTGYTGDWIYA